MSSPRAPLPGRHALDEHHRGRGVPGIVKPGLRHAGGLEQLLPLASVRGMADGAPIPAGEDELVRLAVLLVADSVRPLLEADLALLGSVLLQLGDQ